MLGIIGGSGLYNLVKGRERISWTNYGTSAVVLGKLSGKPCAFIARHGKTHSIPPHRINHKANISALKELGVDEILSVCSVGIISRYSPGDIVIVRDFLSFCSEPKTFFDDFSKGLSHTDMTEPYDKKLIERLRRAARISKLTIMDNAVIAHAPGPRFETKAEIKAFGKLGANIVGMTSVPEAILSNELEIPFANIAIATNFACGISKRPQSAGEVLATARSREEKIRKLLEGFARAV